METLLLARAKHLLDRVSNNVKYPTLDGSPALPAEAAALIECLGKLGLVEDADAMRKDFIVYFAHEVRLPNTGLDPRFVEFRSKANELFGPFLKYSLPDGDWTVVRLRLIDQFDGLRITFKKLSMLSSPLTPPARGTGADEGGAGSTTHANQGDKTADEPLPVAQENGTGGDAEPDETGGSDCETTEAVENKGDKGPAPQKTSNPRKYMRRSEAERIAKKKRNTLWPTDNQSEWARQIGCNRKTVPKLKAWHDAKRFRDNCKKVAVRMDGTLNPKVIEALHKCDASALGNLSEKERDEINAMPDDGRFELIELMNEQVRDAIT